jgi:hypothetical protein
MFRGKTKRFMKNNQRIRAQHGTGKKEQGHVVTPNRKGKCGYT